MDLMNVIQLVMEIALYNGKQKKATNDELINSLTIALDKKKAIIENKPSEFVNPFLGNEVYIYISERREKISAFIKAKRNDIEDLKILRTSIKEYKENVLLNLVIDEKNQKSDKMLLGTEKENSLEALITQTTLMILELKLKNSITQRKNEPNLKGNIVAKDDKGKTIGAKYYALYHYILIRMGKAEPFKHDDNDRLPKPDIVAFAENAYPFWKSGRGFYNEFQKLYGKTKTEIAMDFGRGYKQKLIAISDNDSSLIKYLDKYPN